MSQQVRTQFQELHKTGSFVMPNAWDVGSAKRFEAMGFKAVATTSSGHAATLGLSDQEVTFAQLCEHVALMAAAVSVPVSVDSEQLFASSDAEVKANAQTLIDLGAAGLSLEDYDPATKEIESIDIAVARVEAAARATHPAGVVLTARSDNYLYGLPDLDDTITRLCAFRDAGADVVYAPGLVSADQIAQVVASVGCAVNALLYGDCPGPQKLASLGVRRVSTGGRLASVSYAAAETEAAKLLVD